MRTLNDVIFLGIGGEGLQVIEQSVVKQVHLLVVGGSHATKHESLLFLESILSLMMQGLVERLISGATSFSGLAKFHGARYEGVSSLKVTVHLEDREQGLCKYSIISIFKHVLGDLQWMLFNISINSCESESHQMLSNAILHGS